MKKINYLEKELKKKIIYKEYLTEEEISLFFDYVIYKVNKIITYKDKLDNNISKEYTALFSEVCYSYNLDTEKLNINNHYYCLVYINNNKYLCDLSEEKYKCIKVNKEDIKQYINYIKEKYKGDHHE